MNPRITAIKIILKLVQQGKSFAKISQESFVQEICYGVARWYLQLDFITKQLLKKPLKAKDLDIYTLILTALYELMYMRTPAHAIINESVNNARALKKEWACGLINATLRNFVRQKNKLLASVDKNIEAKYSHPKWLINKIREVYPHNWEQLFTANNSHPPMSLRINLALISRENYLKKVTATSNTFCSSCITLKKPCPVAQLPNFDNGEVSVQDCGAQFAASLLDLQPKQRILDSCAAPGGKTMHILEMQPNIKELIAIDHDKKRLNLIRENLQRTREKLSQKVTLLHADASQPENWWDHKLFDRILLDAPCSATGVIRRHPDIKILKKSSDIPKLATQQLKILTALWPLLNPNGKLVYVTCSILPEENDQVIEKFLAITPNAHISKIDAIWGMDTKFGRQIIPGQDGMDGFYYAVICKTSR
jgi:16S rRNA (cytosine967-C5)-methyltransferase